MPVTVKKTPAASDSERPHRRLPRVDVSESGVTPEEIASMTPEEASEILIAASRQSAKLEALSKIVEAAKARLMKHFETSPEGRAQKRVDVESVGAVTYSSPASSTVVKDADKLRDTLDEKRLRASYKPDVKVLANVLTAAERKKYLTTKTNKSGSVKVIDRGGELK